MIQAYLSVGSRFYNCDPKNPTYGRVAIIKRIYKGFSKITNEFGDLWDVEWEDNPSEPFSFDHFDMFMSDRIVPRGESESIVCSEPIPKDDPKRLPEKYCMPDFRSGRESCKTYSPLKDKFCCHCGVPFQTY